MMSSSTTVATVRPLRLEAYLDEKVECVLGQQVEGQRGTNGPVYLGVDQRLANLLHPGPWGQERLYLLPLVATHSASGDQRQLSGRPCSLSVNQRHIL